MSSYQDVKTMKIQPLEKEMELSHQILIYAKEHGFTVTNILSVVGHVIEFMNDNAILTDDESGHTRKPVRTEPDTHEKVLKYYGISDEELIRTGGKLWMSQNAGTTVLPVKDLLPDCAESISGKARIIINYDPDFDYYIVRLDESYTP